MARPSGPGLLVLLVSVLASVGCGISTSATFLRTPPRPMAPRAAESVEVFGSGPPTRAHVDVAFIEATQESSNSPGDTSEIIAKLREKAGELGCDALVLNDTFARVDTLSTIFTGDTYDRKGMTSTCILYTDAAAPAFAGLPEATPRPPGARGASAESP